MRALIVALCLLLPASALGQALQFVPPWHMSNGEACYDFNDARKLVEIDSKLRFYSALEQTYPKALEGLRLSNQALTFAISKKEEVIQEQTKLNTELTESLKTCTAQKNTCESNYTVGLGWAIGGGVAILVLGGVVGFLAANAAR